MKDQQTALLRQQIEKLSQKKFDLNAWKKQTMMLLVSIFGEESQKVKEIGNLEYEYNSWSLRDNTGFNAYEEGCKKTGRAILEASISEIELADADIRAEKKAPAMDTGLVLDALQEELKGSQFKSLLKILKSDSIKDEKERKVAEILQELGPQTTVSILKNILMNEGFKTGLPD